MDLLKLQPERLRLVAAPAVLAALILICQPAPSLGQQVNGATWMSDQSDSIANIPLKGIAMLGTHDSAMYIEPGYSDLAKTQLTDYNGQLNLGVRWFDTRIVRLSHMSGFPQYFEPDGSTTCEFVTGASSPSGNNYYLYGHGDPDRCTGVTLAAELDEISHFLDQHPKEIIILQLVGGSDSRYQRIFSTGYPDGNNDVNDVNSAAAFEAVLDQHLRRASDHASYIYDLPTSCTLAGNHYTSAGLYQGACSGQFIPPQEVTPQQLWTTSARVILLEQFYLGVNLPSGISPQLTWIDLDGGTPNQVGHERLTGYFGNGTCDSSTEFSRLEIGSVPDKNIGLYGYRPNYQSYESDSRFLTMQAALTPYGDGPDKSLCGVSPYYEAGSFNPQLNSNLQSSWQPYSVNIVSIDRADDASVLQNVVSYNRQTFGRVSPGPVPATRVVAGRDGNIYETAAGEIWKRIALTGQPTDWIPIGIPAILPFAVDPSGTFWTCLGSQIFINGSALTMLVNGQFSFGFFDIVDIASDPYGAIYAVGSDGNPYFVTHDASAINLTQIPNTQHNFKAITAGPANTITAIDASGSIWQTSNYYSSSSWHTISAAFKANSITADNAGGLWATSSSDGGVWQLAGGSWTRYRGNGVQVSVGPIPAYLGYDLGIVYTLSPDNSVHSFRYNLSTGLGAQAPPPKRYAVGVSVSGLTFNHATQAFTGTLTVTNTSGSVITDQLAVVYQGLPQGVTVANNPLTYQGLPFTLMPTVTLQPGDTTSMQVQFSDPNLVHINYQTQVFAYVAGS